MCIAEAEKEDTEWTRKPSFPMLHFQHSVPMYPIITLLPFSRRQLYLIFKYLDFQIVVCVDVEQQISWIDPRTNEIFGCMCNSAVLFDMPTA